MKLFFVPCANDGDKISRPEKQDKIKKGILKREKGWGERGSEEMEREREEGKEERVGVEGGRQVDDCGGILLTHRVSL